MRRFRFPVLSFSQARYALKLNAVKQSSTSLEQGYGCCRVSSRNFCAPAQKAQSPPQNPQNQGELTKISEKASEITKNPGEIEIQVSPEVTARQEFYRQRKQILKMDEADITDGIGAPRSQRLSLLEVREGTLGQSAFRYLVREKTNQTDQLAFIHADIDLRWSSLKRWWAGKQEQEQITLQEYSPQRNSVLGNDLAAAHFIVFRSGRVKFMGQPVWVEHYRVDHEEGKEEEDLPTMQFELCTLPTKYDPRYLVEAVDASNITELRFEGLRNLENLKYCKYLKFENCVHLEAWCIDRLASYFSERLEYLDLSGCTGLTEGALCAIARFRKLKTLVIKNLPQIKNKAVICAMLEDMNPNLEIIGVDYEEKLQDLIDENERLNKKAVEEEANTITIESEHDGPNPNPDHSLNNTTANDENIDSRNVAWKN